MNNHFQNSTATGLNRLYIDQHSIWELDTLMLEEPETATESNQTNQHERYLRAATEYVSANPVQTTTKPSENDYLDCALNCLVPSLFIQMDQAGMIGQQLTARQIAIHLNVYHEYPEPISKEETEHLLRELLHQKSWLEAGVYRIQREKRDEVTRYRLTITKPLNLQDR